MPWKLDPPVSSADLCGVWCAGDVAIAVGQRGTILVCGQGARSPCPSPQRERLPSIGLWRKEDGRTNETLYAVDGDRDTVVVVGGDLHVGGESLILSRSYSGWQQERSGIQHLLLGVCRSDAAWTAVGYNAGIVQGQPGAWAEGNTGTGLHLFDVCQHGRRTFACGLSGTILEHGDTGWKLHTTPTSVHLRGICSVGLESVYAVGLGGTIVHFDGNSWRAESSPTDSHLEAVWGDREDNVYAVGYDGCLLQFDGASWRMVKTDCRVDLYAVGGSERRVVAVGAGGAILRLER